MAFDRSTTVTPQDDGWIGQAAIQDRRTIAKATLPALKLEPFNGDHTRLLSDPSTYQAALENLRNPDILERTFSVRYIFRYYSLW